MRKNTVRAGFVGSDFAANIHRAYGTNVEVVGIHAGDQAKAAAFADAHGGEAFAELDALHIVAPSSLHEAFAVRALERNVHAIVEKPLTGYFGDGGDGFDARNAAMSDAEIVMGGIHNWLEVCANNHRTICDLNPNDMMQTYNLVDAQFDDIYVVKKTGTQQGWAKTAPDEDSTHGFPQEVEAFYRTVVYGDPVESDSQLAADTISTVYSRYLSAEQEGAQVTVELL